jgi:predicted Zn-dependent protease
VSTNPATGRSSFTGGYSPEDDVALGAGEHPKMLEAFGGEYHHPKLQRYVDTVGRRLATHAEFQQFTYRFTILNSPIVNAFALPGGYVYLSRGLLVLASNEAEMAGVLAHELGHVNARHVAERMGAQQMAQLGVLASAIGAGLLGLPADSVAQIGQTIAGLAIQSYSREQELESDILGIRYMSRAGYDPDAMATFLSSLREQSQLDARAKGLPPGSVDEFNLMATHPRTLDRVRAAQAAAQTSRPQMPRVARDEYLGFIDGMLFGDDPEHGVVRGRTFVHPGLRFAFTVPEGFRIQNAPDKVVANDTRGASIVFDLAPVREARTLAAYLQGEWAPEARLAELETLRVNGLRGATARTTGRTRSGSVEVRLLVLERDARSVFRFLFLSPQARTPQLDLPFRETTYSFRTLDAREAATVRALRLNVRAARAGDRVADLASTLPYGRDNEDWFRVLNDLPPGAEPTPPRKLKVVGA